MLTLPVHAALTLSFAGNVVRVDGATPRGQVALVAVMRETNGLMIGRLSNSQQLLTDSDGDGSLEYDLKRPIPPRSIWAAVDLESGESALQAPADYPTRETALPTKFVKNAPADEFDTLIADHIVVQVLWVRPGNGGGAWILDAADGGANDSDAKSNGHAVVSTASFVPLGDSHNAPKKLKSGDVLVVLDPFAMTSSRGVIPK